jgi:hypothetical protein
VPSAKITGGPLRLCGGTLIDDYSEDGVLYVESSGGDWGYIEGKVYNTYICGAGVDSYDLTYTDCKVRA